MLLARVPSLQVQMVQMLIAEDFGTPLCFSSEVDAFSSWPCYLSKTKDADHFQEERCDRWGEGQGLAFLFLSTWLDGI